MELYSTNNRALSVSLKKAVLKGLPDDNGLFMPKDIPVLPKEFIENLPSYSFAEIAFVITKHLFQGAIPEKDLERIIANAVNFPAPVVSLDGQIHVLELFHGPSLAFKDFGARFMAQLMSYFNQGSAQDLVILVATSGDTGGAVAAGFYQTPGIKVVILYPSGKVSALQEKQLTTLGHNIHAIEVNGTFDDCQDLVKKAFLDTDLQQQIRFTSANSINISRLIPQSFYYFEAYKQLADQGKEVVFCVPSGNFGNLTAGMLAQKMGLPIHHFVAATNVNDVVPQYLREGLYTPRPSTRTISNAMDVGNPSNFARMKDLFLGTDERSTWNNLSNEVSGYAYTDEETEKAILELAQKYNYIIDPHGAVGYLALKEYLKTNGKEQLGVVLGTAHYAKFLPDMERVLEDKLEIPERLKALAQKEKMADQLDVDFTGFKQWLLKHYV
jgi:threonine synthase